MTPIDVAVAVARALESVRVEYFLGGSMASSLHGQPRYTNDIDMVVELTTPQIAPFAMALGQDFEVDQEALQDAVKRRRSWNIFHTPTVTRVDLFVLQSGEFDVEEFKRRRSFEVAPGERIWVKSPEDTVIRKLIWYRDGGESSSQQLRDVAEVLRVQGKGLDTSYLSLWVTKLGLEKLLERARSLGQG